MQAVESGEVWKRHYPGRRERDRLMLALFAFAGLRRSELLGLDWQDVDLERRLLRIRKAKGGRQRMIPIHPALEPLFVEYLQVRADDPEPALFVGVQGRRLSSTIMVQTFLRYVRAAGVTERKRVTPHTLRHVFASELCAPARTCARSRSCSDTSTSTRHSATRASTPTSCAEPSSACSSRRRPGAWTCRAGQHRADRRRPRAAVPCPVGITVMVQIAGDHYER